MALEPKDLIQEYFDKVGEKYGIPFEKFSAICRAPFMFFRKQMESLDFPVIHVKYFGKFVVFKGSAKKILNYFKQLFDKGVITEQQYNEKTVNLKSYIDDYERENPDDSHR